LSKKNDPQMDVKIEKEVPIPKSSVGRPAKYGFIDNMEIGDSVLLPPEILDNGSARSAASSLHRRANRLGFKITTRSTPEGLRVWRIQEGGK